MIWILSSLLGTFLGINIITFVLIYLYTQTKERYLLYWALGWFISSLRYLLMIFIPMVADTTLIYMWGQVSSLLGGILFLFGVFSLTEKRPPLWTKILFSLGAIWILITAIFSTPTFIRVFPLEILVGFLFITSGTILLSNKKTRGLGNRILGISLILFGFIKSEFSLVVSNEALRPWNFTFLSIIATATSLGVLMVYIQKGKDHLIISEKRYRTLVENANNIICMVDANGNITFLNRFGLEFFGYKSSELVGKKQDKVFGGGHSQWIISELGKVNHSDSSANIFSKRMANSRKDGTKAYVNWSFKPIFDVGKNMVEILIIGNDETLREKAEREKKKLQEQLFQAQKMESLGRLAGGIAHDFNNILASIMGYAEYMRLGINGKKKDSSEVANIILREGKRAGDLTKQLLGFARRGKYNPTILSVNQIITEVVSVSEGIFKKQIKLNLQLGEEIKNIEADKGQFQQVLTNLIINAKDAMPRKGILTIVTENFTTNETFLTTYPEFVPGDYIKIELSDTGEGIPDNIIDYIFEPFFTTKENYGTGLGLATVYGIVKNHRGHIHVESKLDEGTSFILYFPAVDQKKPPEIDIKSIKSLPKGDAAILVVDDESYFRNIIKELLEDLGYTIYLAENGKVALDLFRKYKIDLVLLDIIMPVMDGREAFKKILEIQPEAKVLITSGFSQEEKTTELIRMGALGFLQKPFELEELARIIFKELEHQ